MSNPQPDFMVFTGNANPVLAAEIAGHLGIGLGAAEVGVGGDGEAEAVLELEGVLVRC
jgi:ribose-phosphate pyrophosphokinase